jgi:O-antigen/teichoic acid export membrane protein
VQGKRYELIRLLRPHALGYAASGASLALAACAQLVTFALLARTLGPAEFGQLVAVTAAIAIAAPFCGLGALEGVVRRTAAHPSDYRAMLGHALMLIGVSGVVLVLIGLAVLPGVFPLDDDMGRAVVATGLMLTGGVVLGNLVNLAEHACLAHKQFAGANLIVAGFALARTATAALACLAFGITSAAEWAGWFFACHVVSALAALWLVRGFGAPVFHFVRDEIGRGIWFSLPILARALRQNADVLILGLVTHSHTVASYGIARRILDVSYLSIGALSRLVYPGSANAARLGAEVLHERARAVLLAALLVAGITASAIWLAAPFLPLVFGPGYEALPGFARALCGLLIIAASAGVALDALAAATLHGRRAAVLGGGSLAGAAIIGTASALGGPDSAIAASYLADAVVAAMAWLMLIRWNPAGFAVPARTRLSPS